MRFLTLKPNILGKLLLLPILGPRLDINRQFFELTDSRPKVLDHDGTIEACTIVLVGVGVILDHVHQVAGPVEEPLTEVEALFVVGEF